MYVYVVFYEAATDHDFIEVHLEQPLTTLEEIRALKKQLRGQIRNCGHFGITGVFLLRTE
jgi:hypothetical protein